MIQIVGVPRIDGALLPEGHPHVSIQDFVRDVGAPIYCWICDQAIAYDRFTIRRQHVCEGP